MSKVPSAGFWMSLLFGGAFLSAIFFQGFYTEFLCLTLSLLVLWGLAVVWLGYQNGFSIPKDSLIFCLTAYWVWLGVAGSLGRVAYQGTIGFWWLGVLPLTFWIFTLSPLRDEVWRHSFRWVTMVGIALAVTASYQWLILSVEPNATFLNRQSLAALFNLIALPVCGYFLLSIRAAHKLRRWLIGVALFLFVFAFALIEGRGATICGGIGLGVLLAVAWRRVPNRAIVQLMLIVTLAFLVSYPFGKIGIGNRIESVVNNPWEAGATRLVIWKQSWEMLKQAPWTGVGLGHYALYWPPYRDPRDESDGFFTHNDYLQIWIEAGLPGLLLLLAVLVAAFFAYVRAMRNRMSKSSQRVEATALFAGLLSIAAHSFVDFNLYVLSIMVLAGLILGRMHMLSIRGKSPNSFSIVPSKFMSRGGFRSLAVLITLLPLIYFLTLGLASFEYRRGVALAEESKIGDAYTSLNRAARYYPYADNILMSEADLLRYMLTQLPASANTERLNVYEEAQGLLVRAEYLNPLRPQTFVIRAYLLQQNPDLAGEDWEEKVISNYRSAIALEPRGFQARYLCARFLLDRGLRDEARQVLEDGMVYRYPNAESLIPYFALTATLRERAGDGEAASDLRERIGAIRKAMNVQQFLVPSQRAITE